MDRIPATKRCGKCHEVKPVEQFYNDKNRKDGKYPSCKPCFKLYTDRTREARLKRQSDWYFKNKERLNAKGRVWNQENREAHRVAAHAWSLRNPERRRQIARDYEARMRAKDPTRTRRMLREDRDRNPDRWREYRRNRRARKAGAPGTFTEQEFRLLCDQYGNRCLACGRTDVRLVPDHVITFAQGGTNWITNIQPLCFKCNSAKYTKSTDYRPTRLQA